MLSGVVPALMTPFTAGGEKYDRNRLRGLCEHLISSRVGGLFVTGTTGEFIALSPEERRQVIEDAVEFAGGRTKIIVHACSYNTMESVALAEFACRIGADGVGSLPPYFHPMDEEAQYAFFSRMCEAVQGKPFYLYNLPAYAANEISLPLIRRLKAAFPHLKGIKDSSGDLERMKNELEMGLPDFQVISGADHRTLDALRLGAKASVTSTANAFPEVFQAVYDAFNAGDMRRAEEAQERLTALTKILMSGRYLATYKTALRLRGIDIGTVRPPHRELTDSEAHKLTVSVKDMGLIP